MYPTNQPPQIPTPPENSNKSRKEKRERVISGLMKRKNNIHMALAAVLATTSAAVIDGCTLTRTGLCPVEKCNGDQGGFAGEGGTGGETTGGGGVGGEVGGGGTGGETTGGGGTGGAACVPTGPEICDGIDNDCQDGIDDNLTPDPCAELDQGECLGATAARTCDGDAGWSECVYSAEYEANEETKCDGLDNDCDGSADEASDLDNHKPACAEPSQGECQGVVAECVSSNWVCDYGQNYEAVTELSCDTLDNNCDGNTDEGCITVSGTTCDKVWHFPAVGNDTFLAGSSADNNNCEVSNDMTFMTSTGSHIVVWEDNQNFINLITNEIVTCFAECSFYGSIPPNHTEALTDKNRTFDDVVVVTPNGNDLKEEHQIICQAHTFSCVMQ